MTKMSQCSTCIGDGVHCEHYRPTDDSPCPNYIFDTSNIKMRTFLLTQIIEPLLS